MRKLLSAALLLIAEPVSAQELHLVCDGIVSKSETETINYSGGIASRDIRVDTQQPVQLQISGAEGRIQMPYGLNPILKRDRWVRLKKLEITDNLISAQAAIGVISPRIEVDRITGAIAIRTIAGNYSGRCEAVDPAARRF